MKVEFTKTRIVPVCREAEEIVDRRSEECPECGFNTEHYTNCPERLLCCDCCKKFAGKEYPL